MQCIVCHAIGNAGGLVGPNLISVGGSSQPDYLLEALLDPSAKLKEGYTTLSLLTDQGETVNGIVIGRDERAIRLRLADGKEIQIDPNTVEQEQPGKSLMPEGLMDTLTKSELVDLLRFLSALGREPAFTVSTDPVVRSLETLVYSNEANRKLNRTSTDTASSEDPDMKWRLLTSKVNGTVPLEELDRFQQHRETPPTSFIRFTIEMPSEGVAKIELPGDGIEAWVDSKPTPVWDLAAQKLSAGTHRIVLAIDRQRCTTPFTIRAGGDVK
jgi:putative heme-binding domain-containing protein